MLKRCTLLDIYVPNNKASKYMGKHWQNYKENLIKLIIDGITKLLSWQKITKVIEALNKTLNQHLIN